MPVLQNKKFDFSGLPLLSIKHMHQLCALTEAKRERKRERERDRRRRRSKLQLALRWVGGGGKGGVLTAKKVRWILVQNPRT